MPKILYVEDNDDNLYMLTLRFETVGDYEIISAVDGAEGIAKAEAEQPDLISMDLNLPVVDGWEATRQPEGQRGSDDFDTRPIEFDRLLTKINGLLTRK